MKHVSPIPAEVKPFVTAIGSRKRSVFVGERTAGEPEYFRSYWDSGSRDYYMAWDVNGNKLTLPVSGAPGFTPDPKPWLPARGDVLVIYGTCSGNPATPYVIFYK
jgi:hypothetical protein